MELIQSINVGKVLCLPSNEVRAGKEEQVFKQPQFKILKLGSSDSGTNRKENNIY